MNPSEALYYPISYYKSLGRGCAHYMTLLFAPDRIPYTFEQNERWQSRLETFIITILRRARLDESVAISAMVLLERFMQSDAQRPTYPHENYFKYFFGAYWAAEQELSHATLPQVDAFWFGVLGETGVPQEQIRNMWIVMVNGLHGDLRIPKERYIMIKGFMYAYIYMRMSSRAGMWPGPGNSRAILAHPPCWNEMRERKKIFDRMRSHSATIRGMSDRQIYDFVYSDRP